MGNWHLVRRARGRKKKKQTAPIASAATAVNPARPPNHAKEKGEAILVKTDKARYTEVLKTMRGADQLSELGTKHPLDQDGGDDSRPEERRKRKRYI